MKIKRENHKNIVKKKSFYFEDCSELEESIKLKNTEDIKILPNRVNFIFIIFLGLTFIFGSKIIYLSLSKDVLLNKNLNKNINQIKTRSDIVDRNNIILARNADVYFAGVHPNMVEDKKKLLLDLKIIFPNIQLKNIKKKLKGKKFFYIKKKLTQSEYNRLWWLGNKSIQLQKKQTRYYPQKNLFSHVVGQIDEDNQGISGVEKYFDKSLKNEKLINSALNLTLDSNLQHIIREELIKAQKDFHALGSAAILMNVNNGEILSLLSLPDFNLNHRKSITEKIYTNKITKGVYELGSVFKTFTLAAGLEKQVINPDTMFNNIENNLTCAGYKISEHDKLPENLSAEQILIRSSNIGAVRIAQKLGIDNYRNFLNSLGLFRKINFDLDEVGIPLTFKWGKCKLATASFGHGVTTTPLQLAKAYAIISNGGYEIYPTILKNSKKKYEKKQQIISKKTSNTINLILKKVVSEEEGTANFANIPGYDVGGKTGTAYKSINGVYNKKKKINTFVSLFPISKPKYVLLVMLDEPKPAPDFVYKFPNGYKGKGYKRNTAGWNTVVVSGKIIERIGPILAINYLQASNNF